MAATENFDVTLLPARPPREGEFEPVPALDEIRVGDLVVAHSRGAERVAMIETIGRTNVKVVYTTKGAWDEAHRIVEAYLSRDPDAEARRAAVQAGKNYDYTVGECDAATARHAVANRSWYSEERAEADRAKHRAWVAAAGTRDEYQLAEAERARQAVARARASALEGPARFVHVTRKTVKHADLLGWRRADR